MYVFCNVWLCLYWVLLMCACVNVIFYNICLCVCVCVLFIVCVLCVCCVMCVRCMIVYCNVLFPVYLSLLVCGFVCFDFWNACVWLFLGFEICVCILYVFYSFVCKLVFCNVCFCVSSGFGYVWEILYLYYGMFACLCFLFCNVWICVLDFIIYGCLYVGFEICECVCVVGFVMCGCVYFWVF